MEPALPAPSHSKRSPNRELSLLKSRADPCVRLPSVRMHDDKDMRAIKSLSPDANQEH
jgi:hypothetical protein